jgi:plastocyanin
VRLPACLLALALPVLLAACGGGGGGGGAKTQAASSEPCPSGAVTIHMAGLAFNPEKATAKVGDKVCWVNDDDAQHDAVDESSGRFTSELFQTGMTFTWTADKAGTVKYVCTVHPSMTGELVIQ